MGLGDWGGSKKVARMKGQVFTSGLVAKILVVAGAKTSALDQTGDGGAGGLLEAWRAWGLGGPEGLGRAGGPEGGRGLGGIGG